MSYKITTISPAKHALKKLPKPVKKHLIKELQKLKNSPLFGDQLKPPLRFLRSFHTRYKNSDYRAVYEVDKKNDNKPSRKTQKTPQQ